MPKSVQVILTHDDHEKKWVITVANCYTTLEAKQALTAAFLSVPMFDLDALQRCNPNDIFEQTDDPDTLRVK